MFCSHYNNPSVPFAAFLWAQHMLQRLSWNGRLISSLGMKQRGPTRTNSAHLCEPAWASSSVLRLIKKSHVLTGYRSIYHAGLIWSWACACINLQCLQGINHTHLRTKQDSFSSMSDSFRRFLWLFSNRLDLDEYTWIVKQYIVWPATLPQLSKPNLSVSMPDVRWYQVTYTLDNSACFCPMYLPTHITSVVQTQS